MKRDVGAWKGSAEAGVRRGRVFPRGWGRRGGEAVMEEGFGVVPFVFAVEDDELEFVAVAGGGGGVGVVGFLGPAGFGGAHAGVNAEELVVVDEEAGAGLGGEFE